MHIGVVRHSSRWRSIVRLGSVIHSNVHLNLSRGAYTFPVHSQPRLRSQFCMMASFCAFLGVDLPFRIASLPAPFEIVNQISTKRLLCRLPFWHLASFCYLMKGTPDSGWHDRLGMAHALYRL